MYSHHHHLIILAQSLVYYWQLYLHNITRVPICLSRRQLSRCYNYHTVEVQTKAPKSAWIHQLNHGHYYNNNLASILDHSSIGCSFQFFASPSVFRKVVRHIYLGLSSFIHGKEGDAVCLSPLQKPKPLSRENLLFVVDHNAASLL